MSRIHRNNSDDIYYQQLKHFWSFGVVMTVILMSNLRSDESENPERLGFTVLLLGHAGRDLPGDFDAVAILPSEDFNLPDPQCVLRSLHLDLDDMVVPAGQLAGHPAHVSGIQVDLAQQNMCNYYVDV